MEASKKAFDSTAAFMMFGPWMSMIDRLETEQDRKSSAYRLFRAIADYSMYGESPDFSDLDNGLALDLAWTSIEERITKSIENRKRGFAPEGMTPKQKAVVEAYIANPGASCRDIERITRVSSSEVSRTHKKYAQLIAEEQRKRAACSNSGASSPCGDTCSVVRGYGSGNLVSDSGNSRIVSGSGDGIIVSGPCIDDSSSYSNGTGQTGQPTDPVGYLEEDGSDVPF